MSPVLVSYRRRLWCVPRASGDEPTEGNQERTGTLCSPRERG